MTARPDLAELARLLAEGTRRPWETLALSPPPTMAIRRTGDGRGATTPIGKVWAPEDAALIIAAVDALPFLLAEARKVEALRAALERIEALAWYAVKHGVTLNMAQILADVSDVLATKGTD